MRDHGSSESGIARGGVEAPAIRGTPISGLSGATLGFFVGFAAVSLFGPTVDYLQFSVGLTPALAGLLISIPNLTGSLLRIPFSAMVDTTGGRRPFLILLGLSIVGVAGVFVLLSQPDPVIARLFPLLLAAGGLGGCGIATFSVGISQTAYWFPQRLQGTALGSYAGIGNLAPGIFAFLIGAVTLPALGLSGSYLAWLVFLCVGTLAYALLGRNAWYFQLRDGGMDHDRAREHAATTHGQELFPQRRMIESLKASAGTWKTWALVGLYFTTFGGFLALTGWLPKYWMSFHGLAVAAAGGLTALYSVLASLVRIAGGRIADRLGGTRTATASLLTAMAGSVLLFLPVGLGSAVGGIVLMAVGMGVCNAAVFKIAAHEMRHAIGGAAGWIGGLGAFGGFVIPNLLALFLTTDTVGDPGYRRGFLIFTVLCAASLVLTWALRRAESKTNLEEA